jgi:hypothetical protein
MQAPTTPFPIRPPPLKRDAVVAAFGSKTRKPSLGGNRESVPLATASSSTATADLEQPAGERSYIDQGEDRSYESQGAEDSRFGGRSASRIDDSDVVRYMESNFHNDALRGDLVDPVYGESCDTHTYTPCRAGPCSSHDLCTQLQP